MSSTTPSARLHPGVRTTANRETLPGSATRLGPALSRTHGTTDGVAARSPQSGLCRILPGAPRRFSCRWLDRPVSAGVQPVAAFGRGAGLGTFSRPRLIENDVVFVQKLSGDKLDHRSTFCAAKILHLATGEQEDFISGYETEFQSYIVALIGGDGFRYLGHVSGGLTHLLRADANGVPLAQLQLPLLSFDDLAVDGDGTIYAIGAAVSENNDKLVHAFDQEGKMIWSALDATPEVRGHSAPAISIGGGRVYVSNGSDLFVLGRGGELMEQWKDATGGGIDGWPAVTVEAVGSAELAYIALDSASTRVGLFDVATGTRYEGDSAELSALLNLPLTDQAVGEIRRIIPLSISNGRVLALSYSGVGQDVCKSNGFVVLDWKSGHQ